MLITASAVSPDFDSMARLWLKRLVANYCNHPILDQRAVSVLFASHCSFYVIAGADTTV